MCLGLDCADVRLIGYDTVIFSSPGSVVRDQTRLGGALFGRRL